MKINRILLILSMVLIISLAISTASASDVDDSADVVEMSDVEEVGTVDVEETIADEVPVVDDSSSDAQEPIGESDETMVLSEDDPSDEEEVTTKTIGIYIDNEYVTNISISNNGNLSMNMTDMMDLFTKMGLDNISSMFNMSNIDMSNFNMSNMNISDIAGMFNMVNNSSNFYFSIDGKVGIVKYNLLMNLNETDEIFDFNVARPQASTVLTVKNMTTKPVTDRTGKYFTVILKDALGNPLANKEVQIALCNKIYKRITDKNGIAKLQVNLKKLGTYPCYVCFLGDEMNSASFEVATITVSNKSVKEALSSGANGNAVQSNFTRVMSIYLDNELFTNIKISGDGNSMFNLSANASDLMRLFSSLGLKDMAAVFNMSDSPTFNISNFDMSQFDFSNFDMSSFDISSLKDFMAMFAMMGQSNSSRDSNSTFDFKINGEVGIIKYNMLLYLNETDDVFDYSILRPQVPSIITAKDLTTKAVNVKLDGKTGGYFSLNLKDALGSPLANKEVLIGIDNKVYKKKTDAQGNAKIQINMAKAGSHTCSVAFLGDELTAASFDIYKITIKKQATKIASAKKSYKASIKTKSLTATLKNSAGKALANKKVTFKVNGKTYTATTNSKGVAKVNVSLSKKGTYKFTAKFAGDKTYAAISKSANLVIN